MKRTHYIQLFLAGIFGLAGSPEVHALSKLLGHFRQDTTRDTTGKEPYSPGKRPTYRPSYRYGDPFSSRSISSPLLLKDPSNIDFQVEFDTSGVSYSVYERLNELNFRPATSMSFREFDRYTDRQINKQYWKSRSSGLDGESAVSGRRLIPKLYLSPVFDRIFGGSYVDIQPTGFVNLDFGGRWQFVDNPQLPLRQRRNGGFNFNMQFSTNIVGKIGEKLAVTFNFDNNNIFKFQNNMKIEYTGYKEDIIKKIEIGNVGMPVENSLIAGAQSLFGIKTQLQFGKLYVTTIASRQMGRGETVTVGGGQGITNNTSGRNGADNISILASDYDDNRHFFLGHFFRDNYEQWHKDIPQINSGLLIRRVEVYSINRNNDTRTVRNFVALMDLGEGDKKNVYRVGNPAVEPLTEREASNDANGLFRNLVGQPRQLPSMRNILNGFGFEESTDYVAVNTARKLDPSEYVVNEKLGYISLLRKLQNDEVLAVSYEYAFAGNTYKVGELTEDYQGRREDEAIILKMLRPNRIAVDVPTWELMMKNIYNLRATQVQQEGFSLRIHYKDDRTGQDNPSLHEGRRTKDYPLIELLGLDRLNRNNDRQKDGNFDFIPGVTINTVNGNIIFPYLEPFGGRIQSFFDPETETDLIDKFVYDTLYKTTKANAELISAVNKYVILGSSTGTVSNVIRLNGFNISPGSVTVTAGGQLLTEGLHYDVDYNLGQVRIRDEGILQSGRAISVSYEKADLFDFQTRWLMGAHFDYRINDNFNIGATVLRLNERRTGIQRFSTGQEPNRNTKYGINFNWQDESPLLTKIVDALPLINTKEPSTLTFNAEFAQLVPGTSNIIQGTGTSFIDSFEDAVLTAANLGTIGWHLAATPQTRGSPFEGSGPLGSNDRRAKIAWYIVDPSVFYRSIGRNRPDNINEDDLANHYVRAVLPQEIFTQRDREIVTRNVDVFDVAYFPEERGQYNYNPATSSEGLLPDPRGNWGGISRAITTDIDFVASNVEYLEFWMLDPFIDGPLGIVQDGRINRNNATGGDLIFNLGNVSEDLIKDGRHGFENGLPEDGDPAKTVETAWGRTTDNPYLTNVFVNESRARANQDVGLDGLKNEDEKNFASFPAVIRSFDDPSGDDFQHYLGGNLDAADAKILERYKNFNGLEGNSPVSSGGAFTPASTPFPNNEDMNTDNTISDLEEFFEYTIPLRPGGFRVGENHVVEEVSTVQGATWYLFRIPIQNPNNYTVAGSPSFNNIKYVRMYLTRFSQPVVLRLAKFQLVGSRWRKSTTVLNEIGLNEIPETTTGDFDISVVNIEENGGPGEGIPYTVPPGLERDRDNTTAFNRQINEQALQLCVKDLEDGDARAVFKTNLNEDLINYGRIKMFFHAQPYLEAFVQDDEVNGFLRLGSDENENFYEIEVPLKITAGSAAGLSGEELARFVWPVENEIDMSIKEMLGVKSQRNIRQTSAGINPNDGNRIPFSQPSQDGRYRLTVKGNPDISNITTLLIGVRNPGSEDRETKSVCIWANELRVTDFDSNKGWAANARLSMKLADLGNISASTRYTSIGFGSIQQRISERTRAETFQYDISASLNIDKFLFPKKSGLKIPMFMSYENSRTIPQFDPLDPDIPLDAALQSFGSDQERRAYRRIVEDRRTGRSLNFTNVRKEKVNPDAGSHIYDIENFSFTYAYSDIRASSVNQQYFLQKTVSGGVAYNYSPPALSIEPFAGGKAFSSPFLQLIKDINFSPLPANLTARADLNRSYRETQLYNDNLTTEGIDPFYERLFTFNRSYGLRWNIFKGLALAYNAQANAVIDEPDDHIQGDIDTPAERQFIWREIQNFGRMKRFSQDISANYKLPLDKLPVTDWMSADYRYNVGYTWTAGFINREDGNNTTPDATDDSFFGNFIGNRRDQAFSGKLDMVKLYNKIGYLKKINTPARRSSRPTSGRVQANDGKGDPGANKTLNGFLRLLMSLRSVNATYNVRESTILPGLLTSVHLFGLDRGFGAPGWRFILGSQDASIRQRAAENGWLTQNPNLTSPFEQTKTTDFTLRASLEPTNNLKIKLDASRSNTSDFQEIFRFDPADEVRDFRSFTPSRGGSYSISFLTINTAFEQQRNYNSKAFDRFTRNIEIMRDRLNQRVAQEGIGGQYESLSQDILIPAFLAAYTGKDAERASTSPFPKIPVPNWRVDYAGLSDLPGLSDFFSSINITHGYRSVYAVTNYTNSLRYQDRIGLENNIMDYPLATLANTLTGNLIPVYIINQITIAEQFTPLLGINVRTKTNFTGRLEFKRDRNLSLNLSNAQVSETLSNEVAFDFGYTKNQLKLPFRSRGRVITIENDVTFRMNMSIRNARTIQRNPEGENTPTNGNKNFQMRPTISYKFNDLLNITMYYERTVNDPIVGSFRRAATTLGFQLRFILM